jgi:anaerobic magnesium-protoporphyrin IX monomethyl ester cyclase
VKILLINPYQIHLINKRGKIYNRVWPPLDLANCGALLERDGHQVRIIDANALRLSPDQVAGEVSGYDKVFISSSSLDRWQCPNVDLTPFLDTVTRVRQYNNEMYVLGAHGTVRPEEMLDLTQARAVVRGEPELTIQEICRETALEDMKGLAFRENGEIRLTEAQSPLDLNSLPIPAFHLLPMNKYHYEVLGRNFTLFEGSRGCASKCIFCLLKMYGKGVRKKSVDRLITEIEYAQSHFAIKTAYFMDLEFTVFRRQVLELCDYLSKRQSGLRWTCQTRFDLVDEELLDRMKRAGCRLIHFGVEAGTKELLESIHKRISMEQIERGMRMVHQAGIESACFFILGFPDVGPDQIDKTIQFANRLNPTYALFHIAIPYPGTALYEQMENKGWKGSKEELFPEACKQDRELMELKQKARRAYAGFYLRPRYIASRLSRGDLKSLYRQIKLFTGYF